MVLIVFSGWSSKPINIYFSYFFEDTSFRNALYQTASEYGFDLYHKGLSYKEVVLKIPERLWRSVDTPSLVIYIKFKNMQKIIQKRRQALDEGFLRQSDDDFVPASIRYKDRTVKVQMRLKGDLPDHLEGDKWSFRIHTKSDDQLFGMRRFSIQHPRVRGYQGEILYFETLKRIGVLTPRYFFVQVTINGRDIGLMAVEEHFSKELLEYQDTKIQTSELLKQHYRLAVGLLRAGVGETLPISEVFDAEQLGRFLGVTHFGGAWHALKWHTLRYYFNPLTMHLEPIAFDGELQMRSNPGQFVGDEFIQRMLSDDQIRASYIKTFQTLNAGIQDGSLIAHLKNIEQSHLDILQSEFVFLEPFDENELRARADRVVAHLDRLLNEEQTPPPLYVDPSQYPQLLHVYRVEEGGIRI